MIHLQPADGLIPKHVKWDPVSILNGHFQYANTEFYASIISLRSWNRGLPIESKETRYSYDGSLLTHYGFDSVGYYLLNIEHSRTSFVPSIFRISARHYRH